MSILKDYRVVAPKGFRITTNSGDGNRVLYVLEAPYDPRKHYAVPKRVTIGYLCEDDISMMYPTTKYKDIFPEEWAKISDKPARPMFKRIGMYCAMRAIGSKIPIVSLVRQAFGTETGNSLIDFAMFSLLHKSSTSAHFSKSMAEQLLFSGHARSDSYFSDLFKTKVSQSDILTFKKNWALYCQGEGAKEVWLCIDGSNDDCNSQGVELAEKGHAKSHKNTNIVSFTYAVTNEGQPVTFNVYRGGMVDAKALRDIIEFLNQCNIRLRGVILDRGYCNAQALAYLGKNSIPYIIMVKGMPQGAVQIYDEYADKIKLKVGFFIRGTKLFGVQKPYQVFREYAHQDYLTLFYDISNAADRIKTFLKHLNREVENLDTGLAKYKEKLKAYYTQLINKTDGEGSDEEIPRPEPPTVSENMRSYLSVQRPDENSPYEVHIIADNVQKTIDEKGLYAILSSEELPPAEVDLLYTSRSSSEVQYKIIKTELGYGSVRIHFTPSLYAKFALGFISSILRFEIQSYARSIGRNTTDMIRELNMLTAVKINDVYTYSHSENARQLGFFKHFNCTEKLIDECVKEENDRLAGRLPTPRHRKPGPKPKHGQTTGATQKSEGASVEPDTENKSAPQQANSSDSAEMEGAKSSVDDKLSKPVTETAVGDPAQSGPKKRGVKPGTKRGEFKKDGTPRKKPGVALGTKRGEFKKNGELRKKPGPKSAKVTVD